MKKSILISYWTAAITKKESDTVYINDVELPVSRKYRSVEL